MTALQTWGPFVLTILYTVVACCLGYSAKGKLDMNKVENWSRSGNTMGTIVMIFLIGAGNVSAYTYLGAPGWGYTRGVAAFYVVVYLCLMAYTGYLINPRIQRIAKETGYGTQAEAVGARFNSPFLRILIGLVGTFAMIGNSMIQIIGCGYILNVMSNNLIPTWAGELIIIIAVVSYVYRSGLRAIGWTNILQGCMMLVLSFLTLIFVIYTATGGFSLAEAFQTLEATSPSHLSLPGALDNMPPCYWTTSILISIVSIWPQFWIWAAGAKSEDSARKSYVYVPIFYIVMVPMIIVGMICVFAFPGYDGASDKVSLAYCMANLPWWLVGFMGAGILAASQSSLEPQLHTPAYTLTHDVISVLGKMSPEKEGKLQRKMLLIIAFFVAFPLAVTNPSQLVNILLVIYGFVGQMFPAMLAIFCWPRATKAGTMVGLIAGVIVVGLFNIVWPNPLGIHAGIWGLAVNIPIFIIGSLLTKPEDEKTLKQFFPDYIMDNLYEEEAK